MKENAIKARQEFRECVKEMLNHPEVLSMKNIPQHMQTNCYEHSVYVAYMSFLICRFFKWDFVSAARGGLLHDLFLYNWREGQHEGRHGFNHPAIALRNASALWELNDKEKDIIEKHMWPLTISKMPKYKESFVVSTADKICAMAEIMMIYRATKMKHKLSFAAL